MCIYVPMFLFDETTQLKLKTPINANISPGVEAKDILEYQDIAPGEFLNKPPNQ